MSQKISVGPTQRIINLGEHILILEPDGQIKSGGQGGRLVQRPPGTGPQT